MAIPGIPSKQADRANLQAIENVVLRYYPDVVSKDIHRKNKKASVVLARSLICYLCRELYPDITLKTIGSYLYPLYNHDCVIAAIKSIKNQLEMGYLDKDVLDIYMSRIKSP